MTLAYRVQHLDQGTRSPEGRRALELDSNDVLSVVEAAYEMDSSKDAWALKVLRTTDRALGGGFGAFACVSHEPTTGALNIDWTSAVALGKSGATLLAVFHEYANARSDFWSHHDGHGRGGALCLMTSEFTVRRQPTVCARPVADGGQDSINILATDLDDGGFVMSLAVPTNSAVSPAARSDLTRVAAHVLTAMAFRTRLVSAPRSSRRPRPFGPSSLTETERSAVTAAARGHSTKEIAFMFGIADATVRVLLMRAARRCGVQSRKELLNLWLQSDAGGT